MLDRLKQKVMIGEVTLYKAGLLKALNVDKNGDMFTVEALKKTKGLYGARVSCNGIEIGRIVDARFDDKDSPNTATIYFGRVSWWYRMKQFFKRIYEKALAIFKICFKT